MLIIGHRGCNYKGYNQNTIRAYKKAIEDGAKAIEFDVQLTKDNETVVVHNLNLSKVSNGTGFVREKTLNEIRSLYAGKLENGKDKIPLLSEIFDLCSSIEKSNRPVMNIELKGEGTGIPTVTLIRKYITARKLDFDDFLISSFNWNELKQVNKVYVNLKIALLDGAIRRKELLPDYKDRDNLFSKVFSYGEENYMIPFSTNIDENVKIIEDSVADKEIQKILIDEVKKALNGEYYNDQLLETAVEMGAYSVNLWNKTLNSNFVKQAHEKGLKVYVYTVNDEEELRQLPVLGIDGFFTDYYKQTYDFMKKENLL